MATDATDKLLVASVLERGKRDMDGDIVQPEQEDELGQPPASTPRPSSACAVSVEESQKQPWQEPPAKIEEDEEDKPSTQAELDAMAQDMVGIDDPVRMYLKEIGKVPLLNAEEEVVFAKAIELGEQIVEEPWRSRPLALGVDEERDRAGQPPEAPRAPPRSLHGTMPSASCARGHAPRPRRTASSGPRRTST